MERIISVAVSAYGVIASLPAPARHPDVLRKLYDFKPLALCKTSKTPPTRKRIEAHERP